MATRDPVHRIFENSANRVRTTKRFVVLALVVGIGGFAAVTWGMHSERFREEARHYAQISKLRNTLNHRQMLERGLYNLPVQLPNKLTLQNVDLVIDELDMMDKNMQQAALHSEQKKNQDVTKINMKNKSM
eukprot:TRINITY_DN9103_c0_g1_i2.p1 TRINITY_DN9103_c0_g1~~TRINITY_DN9103_c0_g1_i2.p1  ORF type:complete len:131 (-),score=4.80 TRINITY_DN9103_c0_g1_i2:21-413(-)